MTPQVSTQTPEILRGQRVAALVAALTHKTQMVVCGVAVIGKENNPLYIRAWGEYDNLRFHYICHVALRLCGGKVRAFSARVCFLHRACYCLSRSRNTLSFFSRAQSRRSGTRRRSSRRRQQRQQPTATTRQSDGYLGFLYPIEELKVFGLLTNCRVKLVVAIDDEDWKEDQIKALLRRMQTLYVDTVSNPFHEPDSELYKCANFVRQVERIVEAGLY